MRFLIEPFVTMRLLNVDTFTFTSFESFRMPIYAIASHRWGEGAEASFEDVQERKETDKAGYQKVVKFVEYMKAHLPLIKWLWIDTCCIQRANRSELSEAIESMFKWYREAKVCLAWLEDVPKADDVEGFKSSIWFRRGWTLQELLAPRLVVFLSRDWQIIGRKGPSGHGRSGMPVQTGPSLTGLIAEVTKIPRDVLDHYDRSRHLPVERRMSWAAGRETTREEDSSYCLLGILDVSMTIDYGEGRDMARQRLMESVRSAERGSRASKKREFRKYVIPFSLKDIPVADDFVPQEENMQHLTSFFERPTVTASEPPLRRRIFVVHGKAGVGKTQLCAEFAVTHGDRFSAVFWLDGSSRDALYRSMVDAGRRLPKYRTSRAAEASQAHGGSPPSREEFLIWLSLLDNRNWLLIIDNVDRDCQSDPLDPQAYDYLDHLPTADHGNVIITTRLQRLRRPKASLKLGSSHGRMRLVHAEAREAGFHYEMRVFDREVPHYAILSHVWGPSYREISYDELQAGFTSLNLPAIDIGSEKLEFCARQAAKDGLEYFWIDTCCIDKKSSAELSEAINSMFEWYQAAEHCYVYLEDVNFDQGTQKMLEDLRKSRWFKRGWTLQELLAPSHVDFFSQEGLYIGSKSAMAHYLSGITGISIGALQGQPLEHFSVEERLSWAKGRQTTRVEDQAYSMQGLFDIYMPTIYGERHRAMDRLREEIEKRNGRRQLEQAGAAREGESIGG